MLKKYRNRLVDVLQETGLDSSDYSVSEINSSGAIYSKFIRIQYKDSPMIFTIRCDSEDWDSFDTESTVFSPVYASETWPSDKWIDFEGVVGELLRWKAEDLEDYISEESTPDLLSILMNRGKAQESDSSINFEKEEPFNKEEKEQVRLGLNEIKLLIEDKFHFSDGQIAAINARLDDLDKKLDKLDKIDWKSIAASTIVNLVMTLSMDANTAQNFISLFGKVFKSVVQLLQGSSQMF